ncbi:MAG: tryptophan--tRNA ligase [Chloroflexi bacterium]|nr:tryptophan--tRNA ligase [Chloroflexota bacterium]
MNVTRIQDPGGAPDLPTSLTGIKPTGHPHLGNYYGAIRPALELAKTYRSMYFVADGHALTSLKNAEQFAEYSRSVAATWIAAGLDPARTLLYRQSDVPETYELAWILSCFTAKGLMNRAHAYKAAREKNRQAGVADEDLGVNMGLFSYPVLMAADILLMRTDVVPVGRDQMQHVEYASDIAKSYNSQFGSTYALLEPRALVDDSAALNTVPGTDGRKMSKSLHNTIPLFASPGEVAALIARIRTDSTPVEAPKNPDDSALFRLVEIVADPEAARDLGDRLRAGGTGWGEVKKALTAALLETLAPLRERYDALVAPGSELDDMLAHGAMRARERALPVLEGVRTAVGFPRGRKL